MSFPKFLRIGIVTNMDIFEVNTTEKRYIQIIGGLEANFIKLLSDGLHFTYRAHIPDDREWGRLTDDGKWTGVIGLLTSNQTDIGVSKIGISYEKLSAVDFSYPYSIEGVTFATQPPGFLSKETAVALPFSKGLWITLLITLVSVTIVLKFALKQVYTFQYIFIYVIGSLFMNAKGITPKRNGERFLVSAWLLGSMLLSYSYMAVLLSFLTIPLKEQPVNNKYRLLGALDKRTYKCVTPGGSNVLKTLLTSNDKVVVSIATHIEKNGWLINPTKETLVDAMNQKEVAVINPRNHFRIFNPNQILLAKDYFLLLYWGIAINKNFCCKKELDSMVHRIVASGLYQKFENDFYFKSQLKYSKLRPPEFMEWTALKLQDVISAFLLLLFGYIIAIISISIEILYQKKMLKDT